MSCRLAKRHQPSVRESACQTTEPSLERVAAQDRPRLEIDQTEMNDSDERGWVGEAGGQVGQGKELDHASASYPAANGGVAVPVSRSISNSLEARHRRGRQCLAYGGQA